MDVVLDQGPEFPSQIWQASLSSAYPPQTNGQTKQAIQDLEAAFRCTAAWHPASWAKFLLWIEQAHNTLVSSAMGKSHFLVVNGFQPPTIPQPGG